MLNEWRFSTSTAVAVEQDAARRAQRQRPLVVVLGHLFELRVLDDLEHPEARRPGPQNDRDDDAPAGRSGEPRAPAIFGTHRCHCVVSRRLTVRSPASTSPASTPPSARRRSTSPGTARSSWNATTPTTALPSAWLSTAAYGDPKCRKSEQHVQPHEDRPRAAPSPRRTPRTAASGCATMNCVPMMPARNPTIVFASPPMPMIAARQRVLRQPGRRAGQQPRHRARRQRDVDHHDQHQIERRGAARRERASVVCSASASAMRQR